jgi:DnaK suppressor protein
MDIADLREIREILLAQKEELLQNAANTVNDLLEPAENYPDPTDRASAEADRSFKLRLRERELNLLNKINKALDRMNNGGFGICEVCGEEINVSRLKARPVSTLCIDCKNAQEEREK